MAAYGTRLKLRMFLEGIEIPIISINTQSAPNSPIYASIQIPPLAEGTRFLPRTIVHVYFLDLYAQKTPLLKDPSAQASSRNPSNYERRLQDTSDAPLYLQSDGTNDNYKLLFAGEIVGYQFTKTSANRSLVLQCADFSNYWDYAFQWSNTGIFGPGIKAIFSGGSTNLFTDFLQSSGSILTQIVSRGRCNTYPKLKGLAAGIVRLIEGIGGTYQVRTTEGGVKKLAGQNIFFSLAELRLHITQMIGAIEDDPTSQRLLARQGYTSLFNRALGNLGGQTSIRQAINALSAIIFHETYGQHCPYYLPGKDDSVSGVARRKLTDDPQLAFVATLALKSRDTVQTIKGSLSLSLETNPELKVLSVSSYRSGIVRQLGNVRTSLNRTQTTTAVRRGAEIVRSLLSRAAKQIGQAQVLVSRWRPAAPEADRAPLLTRLDEAVQTLERLSQLTIQVTKTGEQEPARLMQQVFRPDIWFGAPPRCNVLFPEDYDQFSYQRMFLQEPTRFLLKTNDEFFGEDMLFDKFYFAPATGALKKDAANLASVLKNDLLDHELFTGILPVFEKMGEFNIFAARSGTQQNPTKVGFAQRAANFLYFKHRFNARQARVTGKFNPYVACGFPGLIIDRYVSQDVIDRHNELREKKDLPELERVRLLGTHFLGNFTQVSHSVSQAETMGRTEIALSYPRQIDESIEFLGAIEKVQTIQRRQGKDALRVTDVAALGAPQIGGLGPAGGVIQNVTNVTTQYISARTLALQEVSSAQTLPLYGAKSASAGGQKRTQLVPIGVAVSASGLTSPDVAELAGNDVREVVFSAFRVEELVARYRTERADIPAEEFIRPGWYGDIWTSAKIGTAYNTLLGIGSITDPQTISTPSGGSQAVTNEDLAQAQDEADTATTADDPKRSAPSVALLDQNASIAQAAEFLILTYSYIRQHGLDVDEFIRSYTWRPIASMVDMFGTSDLKYGPDGTTIEAGLEGFHSRAFGEYDDLFGLVGPEIENILGIKRDTTVAQKGDTRKRKLEAVRQYVSALLFSRALLG
jgi:hypothetical protein